MVLAREKKDDGECSSSSWMDQSGSSRGVCMENGSSMYVCGRALARVERMECVVGRGEVNGSLGSSSVCM